MKTQYKQTAPQGDVASEQPELIVPSANWLEEYDDYRKTMDGFDHEADIHKWQNGQFWFNDKRVDPSFGKHWQRPYFYHVEIDFTEKPYHDGARADQVRHWLKCINLIYRQLVQPVTFKSGEAGAGGKWKKAKKHGYLTVKAAMFNEYVHGESQPRLHVLFTLFEPYATQLVEDLGETLELLAEKACPCCISSMQVKKISNQAKLLTMLLGVHEGRFFREIVVKDDYFVSGNTDEPIFMQEFGG